MPIVGAHTDRELVADRRFIPGGNDELPHEVVERRVEIGEEVSEDQRKVFNGGLRSADVPAEAMPARLGLELEGNRVGVCIEEITEQGVERLAVFVGTAEFGHDAA